MFNKICCVKYFSNTLLLRLVQGTAFQGAIHNGRRDKDCSIIYSKCPITQDAIQGIALNFMTGNLWMWHEAGMTRIAYDALSYALWINTFVPKVLRIYKLQIWVFSPLRIYRSTSVHTPYKCRHILWKLRLESFTIKCCPRMDLKLAECHITWKDLWMDHILP